jgi:hypothetical protein
MSTKVRLLACLAGAAIPCLLAAAAHSDETYKVKTIIPVPKTLTSFDIVFVDANIHTLVLADRTNNSIDVVNTNTNVLTHQYTASPPFVGVVASPANASGPNGVIIVDQREIWATDGPVLTGCPVAPATTPPCKVVTPSSIKVINLHTGGMIANIPNGGIRRADELCEDVKHEIVLSANDDPLDNFLTFINTETYKIIGKNHKLDGSDPNFKITLTPTPAGTTKVAADGIEQCKFNPRTGSYYLAVPATTVTTTTGSLAGPGVVLKISRHEPFHIEQTITIPASTGCTGPQGLAIGPRHEIQLGCGGASTASIIIDDRSGPVATVIATQTGEGGADEVWYNPGDNSYFIARSAAGKLGVEDAGSSPPQADADVTTTIGSHVVAADMLKNQIYVPVRANTVAGTCTTAGCATLCGAAGSAAAAAGCIAVLHAPNDDRCLAEGMPVLDHDDGDDPVFMRTRCHRERDNDDHDRDRDRDREARR